VPDLREQGFFELLDEVYGSGVAFEGKALAVGFQSWEKSALERRYIDVIYQPISDADGDVIGILAQGIDVTDRVFAEERLKATDCRRWSRRCSESCSHSFWRRLLAAVWQHYCKKSMRAVRYTRRRQFGLAQGGRSGLM